MKLRIYDVFNCMRAHDSLAFLIEGTTVQQNGAFLFVFNYCCRTIWKFWCFAKTAHRLRQGLRSHHWAEYTTSWYSKCQWFTLDKKSPNILAVTSALKGWGLAVTIQTRISEFLNKARLKQLAALCHQRHRLYFAPLYFALLTIPPPLF